MARASLLASRQAAKALGEHAGKALSVTSRHMARATAPARAAAARKLSEPMSEASAHRLREVIALGLLGLTAFLFFACITAWGEPGNWCGRTGEAIAQALLVTLGYAAYLIVLCLALWGLSLFARRSPASFTTRTSGLVLCLISFAALLAHFAGETHGPFPPGGVVGEFINRQLMETAGLGTVGTRIVLLVLTLITFALATDVAYYAAVAAGYRWVQQRRTAVAGTLEPEAPPAPARPAATRGRSQAPSALPARRRGLLSRMLRRHKVDPSSDPALLKPFEVMEDEPGVPLEGAAAAVASPPRRARAEKPVEKPAAEKAAGAKPASSRPAPGGTERAAEKPAAPPADAPRASKPAAREVPVKPAEAAAPAKDKDVARAAAAKSAPKPIEVNEEDEPGVDDEPAADGQPAAPRRAPVVKRPASEEGVQLSLVPDATRPAPPTATAYVFPTEDLLDDQTSVDQSELDALLAEKTALLERTLESFKIEARVVEIQKGPVISMFEMELAPGIKVERVRSLEDDLAIALRARSVRIVAPIPGKNTIGIEVPNPMRENVRMKPLLQCREFVDGKFALPILLGRDSAGRPMITDLAKMPHLLVAGATGSGKSVCLNSVLVSLLYTRTPEQVRLILIDPKMVELTQFANAPHLACPVVSDMKRAPGILEWAISKMEERYQLLSRAGVRNIYGWNKLGVDGLRPMFGERVDDPEFPRFLPFIVIVIDELADLMLTAAKEVENSISRLAAKSRAVGIHLIVATQRPSTNVITGLIKANLPTRIAFMVTSKIDSRVILDENGAEQLLGEGDMLLMTPAQTSLVRGQGTYLSDEEVRRVMDVVRTAGGATYEPELVQRKSDVHRDPDEEDELYDAAARFVLSTERGSASLLQRKFAIGYTRASRLIDMMAEEGVLGEYKGSQARELTMTLDEWIALKPEARGRDTSSTPPEEGEGEEAAADGG
ncbi:MAG TPA: DNA translocase FtsK [Planctomycetota bacterium]|nr:DNA translocase FtsK [Planctomycetota bacterium]